MVYFVCLLYMQKKYKDIYNKVTKLIETQGIPYYVKRWKKRRAKIKDNYKTEYDFIIDLNEYVKSYNPHTSIFYKNNYVPSKKQLRQWKKGDLPVLRYNKEPRKLPHMELTKDGIGIIRFYQYDNPDTLKEMKQEMNKFVKYVRPKLKQWLKNKKLKGLVFDFRYHYGGDVFPIYYSLVDIFNNSTIYGWSNKKASEKDKVWVNVRGNNVRHGQQFLSDQLNVDIPIAIIIGNNTSSSGEFGALMFYGRDNTKFFGQRTSGQLSGNFPVKINKDITMMLTGSLVNSVDGVFHVKEYIEADRVTDNPMVEAKRWVKRSS